MFPADLGPATTSRTARLRAHILTGVLQTLYQTQAADILQQAISLEKQKLGPHPTLSRAQWKTLSFMTFKVFIPTGIVWPGKVEGPRDEASSGVGVRVPARGLCGRAVCGQPRHAGSLSLTGPPSDCTPQV